jgi:hypothetical protein
MGDGRFLAREGGHERGNVGEPAGRVLAYELGPLSERNAVEPGDSERRQQAK